MSTSWQSWLSRLAGAAFTMPLKAIAKKKNRGHCDRHILGSTLFALAPALAKPEPAALHRLFFASLCA